MWDLPKPGIERMTPALAGGFLTTAPTGKSSIRYIWIASFFRGEETKSPQWHGMSMTTWLRSSPARAQTLVFRQMPCPVLCLLLHGCPPSSRTGIKVWNKDNSKINNWFFSICYVLDTVLITSYALLLLLFVIFEGYHYYPHLKKKLGFREHKWLA